MEIQPKLTAPNLLTVNEVKRKETESESASTKPVKDSIIISNTAKAFSAVEKTFDLSNLDAINSGELNEAEKKEYLKMLSTLLKEGMVGYEILEVDGKPEKHFVVTQLGNERLNGAKQYNRRNYFDNLK